MPWGTAASVALHLGLALALVAASLLRPPPLAPPPPRPIAVDLVSPSDFAALSAPSTPAVVDKPPAPEGLAAPPASVTAAPTGAAPPQKSDGTITATDFYAAGILREPKMARIRQKLAQFADDDRVMQLCNIEGLEQIRRAAPDTDPDILVSYAMSDVSTEGLTLIATGGAYRSRRKWYGIQFRCKATPDLEGVSAFSFRLGAPIPESQWDAHDLTAEDSDLD